MIPTVLFLLVTIVHGGLSAETYPTDFNVDIDEVIRNDRLMKNYIDCVMERGKCTREGAELKKDIPDALQNECSKCEDKHKDNVRKVIRHLVKNKPEWWKELQEKFDPKSEYKSKYSKYLDEEGLSY